MHPGAANRRITANYAYIQFYRVRRARGLVKKVCLAALFYQFFSCKTFRSIAAERARMHKHRPARRRHEPPTVKLIFRFARAHIMPAVARVHLNPCVVIVAMAPPWGIYLPRRYANAAQRAYRECRFFSAAAYARKICGNRPLRAIVRRMVCYLFAAP